MPALEDITASGPPAVSGAVHVGRQAMYDREGALVAYELLFRRDADALEATESGVYATSKVIVTAMTEIGIDALVGDARCFVNLTREFLVGELPLPFDHRRVVLEVLETIIIDDQVVAGVAALVEQGYPIALDDFVLGTGHERLLELASYVKIDLLDTPPEMVVALVNVCRRYPRLRLVAERLETAEHFRVATELGFDLFQGYYLGRPQVISVPALSSSRLRRVELLALLADPTVSEWPVVTLVTADPALSMRLLAAANAHALGLPVKVSSVHDAVSLLGVERLRDWATLMLVSDLEDGDEKRLSSVVTRARMCQNMAERMHLAGEAAFTVGLLSAVAEMLDQTPAELAPRLSLNAEVTDALVSGAGPLGELLSFVIAYESSDLPAIVADAGSVPGVGSNAASEADATRSYLEAVDWSTWLFEQ
jgi:EAL and modified HD-GYP domain-containing signal transduction protein